MKRRLGCPPEHRLAEEEAKSCDDLARAVDAGIGAALTILAGTLVIIAALLPIAVLAIAIWFGVRALRRRRPGGAE